jgi:hypothetical protein
MSEVVTFDLFVKGSVTVPKEFKKDKKIYISAE